MTEFKSPRAIEAEVTKYKYERFDRYMDAAERGEIARQLAIQAFKDELDGNPALTILEGANNDF